MLVERKTIMVLQKSDSQTQETVNQLIDYNKKNLTAVGHSKINKSVLIEGFNSEGVADYLIVSARFGYAAYLLGFNVNILLSGFYNRTKTVMSIYKSYGIEKFTIFKKFAFYPMILLRVFFSFLRVLFRYRYSIKSITVDDVLIGDLISDSIIINFKNVYDVKGISAEYVSFVLRGLYEYHVYKAIINNLKPSLIILSHMVYSRFGILGRIGHKNKIDIMLLTPEKLLIYSKKNKQIHQNHYFNPYDAYMKLEDSDHLAKVDAYIRERFLGSVDDLTVQRAYFNQNLISNQVFLNESHLIFDKNKQTILISIHTLSDAPNKNQDMLHDSFYSWLLDTIEIIKTSSAYNYLIKIHPSSNAYGEYGVVEKILYKYSNNPYISIIGINKISNNELVNMVDCTVSVSGTVGIEFATKGIPAVITGSPFYRGAGFTIEPQTISDYSRLLTSGLEFKKLSSIQINLAKLMLYHHSVESKMPNFIRSKIERRDKDEYYNSLNILNEKLISYGYSTDGLDNKFASILRSYIT